METEKITVTLKADTGYDSPWVVFKGDTVAEVADMIGAAEATGLYAIVGRARATFAAQGVAGSVLGATPVQHPATAEQNYNGQQSPPAAPQGGYQQQPAQDYPPQGYAPQNAPQAPQQGYGPAPQSGYGQQAPQGYGPPQQQAPASGPLPLPPGTVARTCPHGTKSLINGRYGPFWGCPARRDDPSRCKPEKHTG